MIGQSQPTVSRHLRLMEQTGILSRRKDGTRTFYRVASENVFTIVDLLEPIHA